MSLRFEITLRTGKSAQGRLRWPDKGLNSAAVSGPHGLGALPLGRYKIPMGALSDRSGQAPYCDSRNNCWFQFINPQFSTLRTDLGVHPDGNVAGTEGCIGLLDSDCRPWRTAFAGLESDETLEVVEVPGLLLQAGGLHASLVSGAGGSWPDDRQEDLERFYGKHVLDAAGQPTAAWLRDNLASLSLPYRMTLAWQPGTTVSRIKCHKKVVESLGSVLEGVLDHYGSEREVQNHRMHLFGGSYNYRRVTGGSRLSTHAWGAAIDLDPDRNGFGKPWDPREGMMPLSVVGLFEAAGWKWGGRFRTPDAMHFQATA